MTATMVGSDPPEGIDALANRMYDVLADSPDGRLRDDLMADLGITDVNFFHQVKGRLQDILGSDQITVVGDSSTNNEGGWTYSLQGDPAHPISTDYVIQKARGIHKRQMRLYNVVSALRNGTDARTTVGRAVRDLQESQRRAVTDTLRVLISLGQADPTAADDDDD